MGRTYLTSMALLGACATSMLMTAPATAQQSRISASEKGSLLIYTKIDACWDAQNAGNLVVDSYVTMNNDQGTDVRIQCYFIAVNVNYGNPAFVGDDYVNEAVCNGLDFGFELTHDQPVWWRASDGTTSNGAGFAPAFPGVRALFEGLWCKRGFILCWAINSSHHEIRFNHLSGGVTIISTAGTAAEYTAYASAVVAAVAEGAASGTPGQLNLNGLEYSPGYDFVLLDFFALGANPFTGTTGLATYLWLMPLDQDLRQVGRPTITKAEILVWNENEFKISGTKRCFACWHQARLDDWSTEGMVNAFLRTTLNTDKGRARIDGIAHNSETAPPFCYARFNENANPLPPIGVDPRDILSVNTSLVGGSSKILAFNGDFASSATHLVGTGTQNALIQWDHSAVGGGGGSPEAPAASPIVNVVDQIVTTSVKSAKSGR